MQNKLILIVVIIFFPVAFLFGGYEKAGFPVLKVPGSARGLASMGLMDLFSSDAASIFTTPAGIWGKGGNFSVNYVSWYQGSVFTSLAVRNKFQGIVWGLGIRSFSIDDIEIRDLPGQEPLGRTGSYYHSLNFAVGKKISDKVKVSGGLKFLYEKHYTETAGGLAADLALNIKLREIPLLFAAGLNNLGTVSKLYREATRLPSNFFIAGLWQFRDLQPSLKLSLGSLTVYNIPANQVAVRLGGEASYRNLITATTGINFNSNQVGFSAGIGFIFNQFSFHYAMSAFETEIGYPQQLSVDYSW